MASRATSWGRRECGSVLVQVAGDACLVINWLRGRWKSNIIGDRRRIGKVLSSMERADRLTHDAR